MGTKWNLKLIRVGRLSGHTNALLLGYPPGDPVELPIWMAAVTDGVHKLLIDTGIGDDLQEVINGPEPTCLQNASEQTVTALRAATGWEPEDVDCVINTHLHFDHCGSNAHFSNAAFFVQKAEYERGLNPAGNRADLYLPHYYTDVPSSKWNLVEGRKELFPGLTLLPTPGHTPGHQSVLIDTKEGILCYAGDAVSVLENIRDDILTSIVYDQEASLKSFALIRESADFIIPGHDYRLKNLADTGFSLLQPQQIRPD